MRVSRTPAVALLAATIAGVVLVGTSAIASAPPAERGSERGSERTVQDVRDKRGDRDGGLPKRVLHGEFTTATRDGGFAVHAVQRGEVVTVTPTSLTVRSADGYLRSYVVDAQTRVREGRRQATIGDVAAGDQVGVRAAVANGVATARTVVLRPER